jgi:RNA polymerase sigma factor (sigma-70 family)
MGNTTSDFHTLLDAFLSNKERPISEFYQSEYPKTKHFILKNGGDIDQVNDIFQEAFFSCWKKLSSGNFLPKTSLDIEAYLFTIAKNKWLDHVRIEAKKRTIPLNEFGNQMNELETTDLNDIHEKEQKLSITLSAFEKLGKDCKNLLTQFYFNKMSFKAIAINDNMEEASIKNKKYRCIQKLKELALNKKIEK